MLRKKGKPDALDKLITLVRNKILTTLGKQRMSEQDTLTASQSMAEEVTHTPNGSIKLGSKVRDVFTGWEGIAMVRERRLEGACLILVEKPADNDRFELMSRRDRANFFDECRLQVVDEELTKYTNPLDKCDIPLGSEVEDKVLGMRGIATRSLEQLNGCVHLYVEYTETNAVGETKAVHFHEDHKRFKVVGVGVSAGEEKVESRPTGCCLDGIYS